MGMSILNVSIPVTVLAAIVAFAFGWLWHMVFGKTWIRLMKLTPKDIKKAQSKSMGSTFSIAFIAQLIIAWTVGVLIVLSDAYGALAGAFIGLFVWVVVAAYTINSVLWENKSWAVWRFNTLYNLLLFLIIGAVMGAWA
jgi:hypothetical protein